MTKLQTVSSKTMSSGDWVEYLTTLLYETTFWHVIPLPFWLVYDGKWCFGPCAHSYWCNQVHVLQSCGWKLCFQQGKGSIPFLMHKHSIFINIFTLLGTCLSMFLGSRSTRFLLLIWKLSSLHWWDYLRSEELGNSSFISKITRKMTEVLIRVMTLLN